MAGRYRSFTSSRGRLRDSTSQLRAIRSWHSCVAPAHPWTMHAHWAHVGRGAAGLGAAMGIGRFAYTPILPLMTTQAALTPQAAGHWPPRTTSDISPARWQEPRHPAGPINRRVAGIARRPGGHPGGNAVAAQHDWLAVVADSRGIRQCGGVRRRGQLDAGSPADHTYRVGVSAVSALGIALSGALVLTLPADSGLAGRVVDRGGVGRRAGRRRLGDAREIASRRRCPQQPHRHRRGARTAGSQCCS